MISDLRLPNFGNVVFTIADDSKEEALQSAQRFANIGYGIRATKGTASYFENHGLHVRLVEKLAVMITSDIPAYILQVINTVGPSEQPISPFAAQLLSTEGHLRSRTRLMPC